MKLIKNNNIIILASKSKVRYDIMKQSGLDFTVKDSSFDEEKFKDDNPQLEIEDLVMELAKGKALGTKNAEPEEIIIGCDQICQLDNLRIDKSNDEEQALEHLMMLSGRIHYQNNAVVVVKNKEVIFSNYTKVKLTMHNHNEEQISNYIKADNPVGCAGSYKYESLGKVLFKEIEGDHFSILGMNIQKIISFLVSGNFITIK